MRSAECGVRNSIPRSAFRIGLAALLAGSFLGAAWLAGADDDLTAFVAGEETTTASGPAVALIACHVGTTRLIDNHWWRA